MTTCCKVCIDKLYVTKKSLGGGLIDGRLTATRNAAYSTASTSK